MKICFCRNGVEDLKELLTGGARLNLSRVIGLFGLIFKVCYFLFTGVVYLFVDGELRFEPSSLNGKRKNLGSIPLRLYFLFKRVVVCGHCLVTLTITSY